MEAAEWPGSESKGILKAHDSCQKVRGPALSPAGLTTGTRYVFFWRYPGRKVGGEGEGATAGALQYSGGKAADTEPCSGPASAPLSGQPAGPVQPLLPVALQQVLGKASCREALCPGFRGVILLVVLKVLNDVPHIAGFDCKQKDNERYSAFGSGTTPQSPHSPRAQKTGMSKHG